MLAASALARLESDRHFNFARRCSMPAPNSTAGDSRQLHRQGTLPAHAAATPSLRSKLAFHGEPFVIVVTLMGLEMKMHAGHKIDIHSHDIFSWQPFFADLR